jgi:phytoene desaturase
MNNLVVVIGGGIGGLSAAIRLQAAGRQVLLLERNASIGGKMAEQRLGDYRWDTGPSVLTMKPVIEALFEDAGYRLEDFLTLEAVDPLTRYFYVDGTQIDLFRDLEPTLASISKVAPEDCDGYRAYLEYVARLNTILGPIFIHNDPPELKRLLQVSPLDALRFDGFRSMQRAIETYVKSAYLRQILGRFATYVGASPYLAPATLNVIGHVELNEGVWYPRGGMYRLAQALESVARELGVEMMTAEPVEQILVNNGVVQGVRLASGEHINAATVLANLDARLVYESLLAEDPGSSSRRQQLAKQEPSSSGFILLLGVAKQHVELVHHNIFFSENYKREFEEIFEKGIPPSDPTIYVAITSKSTPVDAPQGAENWFVMVNVPAASSEWDWRRERGAYRDLILEKISSRGYDFKDQIEVEQAITPLDLAHQSGAWGGALYGASSNNRWAAFRRPHNRAGYPHGLYLAGGTVHPGGGVPMVALSGQAASRMILEDTQA